MIVRISQDNNAITGDKPPDPLCGYTSDYALDTPPPPCTPSPLKKSHHNLTPIGSSIPLQWERGSCRDSRNLIGGHDNEIQATSTISHLF